MSPLVRTAAGFAGALGLLVVLASCGGIEVVSGATDVNSYLTYCRYEVVPRTVPGSPVQIFPVWNNTDFPGQPQLQNVTSICIPVECSVNANNCRNPGSTPVQVQTNLTNESYQLNSIPCADRCAGHLGNW